VERYRSELESRCEAILSKVEGAGAVNVRITLAGGSSREYAQNSVTEESINEEQASGQTKRSSERRQTREVVLSTDSQSGRGQVPVLVTEQAPRIAGVLVGAPGAADSGVKRELARAAQTLLGVPAHRVMVVASRKP
jgi:stage III sporulation protein AG